MGPLPLPPSRVASGTSRSVLFRARTVVPSAIPHERPVGNPRDPELFPADEDELPPHLRALGHIRDAPLLEGGRLLRHHRPNTPPFRGSLDPRPAWSQLAQGRED